jgi:glycosyltransferase involved in cell wall biosynthesis
VQDRLQITGWVSHAREWLGDFDVFALPSRWEGMPLSIIEAMHAGLPVLATDVGSVVETVIDGDTGFVVPRDDVAALVDRLRRLLGDAGLRSRMGQRGRALAAERFTAAAMAQRYEAIYSQILGWWTPMSSMRAPR